MPLQTRMSVRRLLIPLALLGAACSNELGPLPAPAQQRVAPATPDSTQIHVLRQSPTAPRLQTYRMSYWARRGTQTTVQVNYRARPGQSQGDPFLRFRIPINGLIAGANGVPLDRGDSVRITLTIDSVSFQVDFRPSGVLFSKSSPAQLAIWYQDANPDLNGDGRVDGTDQALEQQLAIWTQSNKTDAWKQLSSGNDTTQQLVTAALYHFSLYAVSY